MPGHKPAARRKKPAEQEKKPRKKRPHGFARTRMEPTRRVVHAPESCPECHTTLSGGWVQRTREVIEIPAAPVEVTEHVFMARTCPLCRKRRLPQEPLQGVAAGRQRLGVNPVSLIITLREEGRLPVRTIQWYLRTVHQLKLSVGAIVRTIHQAAQQAGPAVNEVLERIRRSPVVHADETGWRENGVNGCVWTPGRGRGQAFQHAHGAALPAAGAGAVPHGGGWPWKSGCSSCAGLSRRPRRQSGENCAGGFRGVVRLCFPSGDSPDNNAAERSLRHLVISRKISGGTRSGAGSGSKMTLASLFGTWRARGVNPLLECRRLLVSPQL